MTLLTLLTMVGGLAVLTVGAELMVRGASGLARIVGISPLVVGLTVVSMGTSAPEVAVSIRASAAGQGGVALGNVVGSNVFNILVIVGMAAVVAPLLVQRQLVRIDVPVMVVASAGALLLGLDGRIGPMEGSILLLAALGYTGTLVVLGLRSRERGEGRSPPSPEPGPEGTTPGAPAAPPIPAWITGLGLVAVGLVGLVAGANLFVESAVTVAQSLGVSELVIGLTLVAAGTSLPELATSVVAAARGQRDIAVGNAVGSNIYNILLVLGCASVVAPGGLPVPPGALAFDLPVMGAVALACLPIFFTDLTITRGEGLIFLLYYLAYLVYLVLDASGHEAEPLFGSAVLFVAIPLTLLLGGVLWWTGRRPADEPGQPDGAEDRRPGAS